MLPSDGERVLREPFHRRIRRLHRGLAPVMLLILACWGLSGIYFAAYDLYLWYQYRSGNPEAKRREGAAVLHERGGRRQGRLPVATALERAEATARTGGAASPSVRAITFRWVADRPLYEITFEGPPHFALLDADTGAVLSPVTPELAVAIAAEAFGRTVPVAQVERRNEYSFYYFRSGAYRGGVPRGGFVPYYLVWLGDPGRTLVVVSESSGQVLMVRDWWKRLYWWGYWFLHTYLFHPSGAGQLVSDLLLLVFGTIALFGAVTGSYLYFNYHLLRRRSRVVIEQWCETVGATAPLAVGSEKRE